MQEIISRLQALPTPNVIMAVGIPGSGKSTFLKKIVSEISAAYVCPDDIREALTGDAANQSVNTEAWNRAYKLVETAISDGKSVIVDATHVESKYRKLATEKYHSYGARSVVGLVFNTPLHIAKQRNKQRARVVSEHAIERMSKSLADKPPAPEEGFDEVIVLR